MTAPPDNRNNENLIADLEAQAGLPNAWDGHGRADQLDNLKVTARLAAKALSEVPALLSAARADGWDECLDAIEQNELNTEQAREGNPYRS